MFFADFTPLPSLLPQGERGPENTLFIQTKTAIVTRDQHFVDIRKHLAFHFTVVQELLIQRMPILLPLAPIKRLDGERLQIDPF